MPWQWKSVVGLGSCDDSSLLKQLHCLLQSQMQIKKWSCILFGDDAAYCTHNGVMTRQSQGLWPAHGQPEQSWVDKAGCTKLGE